MCLLKNVYYIRDTDILKAIKKIYIICNLSKSRFI